MSDGKMRERLERQNFHAQCSTAGEFCKEKHECSDDDDCDCDRHTWKCQAVVLAFAASEREREREELQNALVSAAQRQQGIGVHDGIRMLQDINRYADDDGSANAALAVLGELERLRARVASQAAQIDELRARMLGLDNAISAVRARFIGSSECIDLDTAKGAIAWAGKRLRDAQLSNSNPQPQSADRATRVTKTAIKNERRAVARETLLVLRTWGIQHAERIITEIFGPEIASEALSYEGVQVT